MYELNISGTCKNKTDCSGQLKKVRTHQTKCRIIYRLLHSYKVEEYGSLHSSCTSIASVLPVSRDITLAASGFFSWLLGDITSFGHVVFVWPRPLQILQKRVLLLRASYTAPCLCNLMAYPYPPTSSCWVSGRISLASGCATDGVSSYPYPVE